jgi:hypothetical protein
MSGSVCQATAANSLARLQLSRPVRARSVLAEGKEVTPVSSQVGETIVSDVRLISE